MNKTKTVLVVALAGVLGLCVFLYVIAMLPQDLMLHQYKEAFSKLQHPNNTKYVARYNFLGALDTQRVMYKETYPQGCDYIVGEIREYIGTQESIKAFYAKQTFQMEQEDKRISVKFIPIDQGGQIDLYGWTEYGPNGDRILQRLTASPLIRLDPSKSLYFVSVSSFKPATADIRCLF